MKKLILAGAALFAFGSLQAQGVAFTTGAWKLAAEKAKKENKLIFVDLYFEGCMPCAQMDKTTFIDPELSKYVNEHFVSYKTDVMKEDDGKALTARYAASGFPTYMFLSPEGKSLDVFSGYTGIEPFKKLAQEAVANNKKKKFLSYSVNPSAAQFPDFYTTMYLGKERKRDAAAATAFLDKEKDLQSENAFLVMLSHALNDRYNQYFLDHHTELSAKYGRMSVRNKLLNILRAKSVLLGQSGNLPSYEKTMTQAKPGFTEKEWNRFSKLFMEDYYKAAKDVKGMAGYVAESGMYDWKDKVTFVGQWSMGLGAGKPADLLPVLSDKEIPSFERSYQMAYLQYKMGDKPAAIAALKEATAPGNAEAQEFVAAKTFLQFLENGAPAGYEAKPVFRMKPLLME